MRAQATDIPSPEWAGRVQVAAIRRAVSARREWLIFISLGRSRP
jgi:hypothetical protein